jgi:hypothetical protein
MKKSLLLAGLIVGLLLTSGCSKSEPINQEVVTVTSGTIAPNIVIGQKIKAGEFTDQFDKKQQITDATKKAIFVFKKATGHTVKELFSTKDKDYLSSRDTIFIADMSKMPSLIFKFVALPDLQESSYSISILTDEEVAKGFINEKEIERIMVVSLDNHVVTKVTFVAKAEDVLKEIE